MHIEFKTGVDKATSFNSPSLLPEEIDIFLNNSIERFVSQRMYGNNPRKEGFEENQKRYDDLITLVSNQNYSAPFTSSAQIKPFGQIVNFPSDYWHAIEEEAIITFTDCNGNTAQKRVPVVPITHDRYNKIVNDPFHQPNENKVVRLGIGGSPEIITGALQTLSSYILRYIRRPASVQFGTAYTLPTTNIDCDLPESTHKEIIKMAVAEALDNIESRRFPIINQELNKIE